MKKNIAIKIIAFIEIIIGISTILGLLLFISRKPLNVFIFVLISAIISIGIGWGLLTFGNWARILLIFFSGYIILTKILMFMGLLYFNGEIISFISISLKNLISILYHAIVMIILNQKTIKGNFTRQ